MSQDFDIRIHVICIHDTYKYTYDKYVYIGARAVYIHAHIGIYLGFDICLKAFSHIHVELRFYFGELRQTIRPRFCNCIVVIVLHANKPERFGFSSWIFVK